MKFLLTLLLSLSLFSTLITAQDYSRHAVILDMTERNNETNDGRLFSCEQMLEVAGIPFGITTDVDEAINYKMILLGSQLKDNNFSQDEKALLDNFVFDGGILLAPRVLDEDFYPIFGLAGYNSTTTNYRINFDSTAETGLFEYINDSLEWEISLGNETLGDIFKSYEYIVQGATPLAHYPSGNVAIAVNSYGEGKAYAFGVPWKDLILRNQIIRHYKAHRVKPNNFEPTQDVYQLLMRTIYNDAVPYSTWKHTSVANSTSTLMITHDIDSRTAVDSMPDFSTSEKSMGIKATYNITLRYFRDSLMSDFYNGSFESITKSLEDGHVLGSHSVGHFFDFDSDDNFPLGTIGNTLDNYTPFNNGDSTSGATVYGECELGKNVLFEDHNFEVRTFRTGHLVFHRYLINVLDSLGYEYNSSTTGNSVLTHFPFRQKMGRSFSGARSDVYEIPISISDVFHSNPISNMNYIHKAVQWLEVTKEIDKNHGPHTLLIHPNRGYKLVGQEYFLAHMPSSIAIKEMGEFGDFWKERSQLKVNTTVESGEILHISLDQSIDNLHQDISLIIEDGQSLNDVYMTDINGTNVEFMSAPWKDNDLIIYQYDVLFVDNKSIENELGARVYPNPAEGLFNIRFELPKSSHVKIELLDIQGKSMGYIYQGQHLSGEQTFCFNLQENPLPTGIYFCHIMAGINGETVKKVIIR